MNVCASGKQTDQKRKMFQRDVCGRKDRNSNAHSNPNYISVRLCVCVYASQLQNGCSLTKHTLACYAKETCFNPRHKSDHCALKL